MKPILPIVLISLCAYSCAERYETPEAFGYDTEVIAVFTPNGIGDQSRSALMYKGLVQAADELNISFRPVFPLTYEDGAETIALLASEKLKEGKRLIVSTDPEYSAHLLEVACQGHIVDSETTKLLVFDGDFNHKDVYVAHVPFYGLMYKAGHIAARMRDVHDVGIYIANDKYLYIREGRDGFAEGFSLKSDGGVDIVDYSEINDDDTEGFFKRTVAYMSDAPQCSSLYDMVLPICGETIMGFLRYNRENPGSFYTVGLETDLSAYSSDVPFSCVEHLDRVISTCIKDWAAGRLEHYRRFGLAEGWTELIISEAYKESLEPLAREIHSQAIMKEEAYAN